MEHLVGGWSETMDATEDIQKICDQVKSEVEEKTGMNYQEFKAVKYRNQIVNGINLIIKVHVGGEDHHHLRLYQALPCYGGKVAVVGVHQNKTKEDPLIP